MLRFGESLIIELAIYEEEIKYLQTSNCVKLQNNSERKCIVFCHEYTMQVFIMELNNLYNFKNPVRHFINIDGVKLSPDVEKINIRHLCWTKPIPFRIKKEEDDYRTIKMPNILSFVRAYHYYKNLKYFENVEMLDPDHKRISVNLETGDFKAGKFDEKLDDDFRKLCQYDCLLKLDIKEYYGRIYTHYLDLDKDPLKLNDKVLSGLNFGRTSGLLMGNYLSLYFAEYMLSKISNELNDKLNQANLNYDYEYFSDDFYFFCNNNDVPSIIQIFNEVLEMFDFVRNEEKYEKWDYETYNSYNILTRYWKATVRHWNLEKIKDLQNASRHKIDKQHKLVFLNQLIYRLSSLTDAKSKRIFVNNFFKTNHFQTEDYTKYTVKEYDYHQLCFLLKTSPEAILYTIHILLSIPDFNPGKIKDFLAARYTISLKKPLHDEQLYYYYALKKLEFNDTLDESNELVMTSQNQVLISYYLKDKLFSQEQINSLKAVTGEEYWLQNYHLILYNDDLLSDLDGSIKKYLIPEKASKKTRTELPYLNFYKDNLTNKIDLIRNIDSVTESIKKYLKLRYKETEQDFSEEDT